MAIDAKYGKITVENIPGNPFKDDEPVFLIRGRDKAAPQAVRDWAERASRLGASQETVSSAYRVAYNMEAWQEANSDLVKVPGVE